LLSTGYIGYEN